MANRLGGRAGDVASVEQDRAVVGRMKTGDQVEQRGLAGTVRPDNGMDFARDDREIGIDDRADAAELFRGAFNLQHRSLNALRHQESRQRQVAVNPALAHGGGFVRQQA